MFGRYPSSAGCGLCTGRIGSCAIADSTDFAGNLRRPSERFFGGRGSSVDTHPEPGPGSTASKARGTSTPHNATTGRTSEGSGTITYGTVWSAAVDCDHPFHVCLQQYERHQQ
uniref:(northern house mosquito) hypothetical protein n=1 Tax=Culex pipiens TaxID=7175 RepID=A0A8D8JJE1_CULPI